MSLLKWEELAKSKFELGEKLILFVIQSQIIISVNI